MGDVNAIVDRLQTRLGPADGPPVPLEGGITNRNYRVSFEGRDCVVRLPGKDTSLLGISREAERLANDSAARLGIAPAVAAGEDDCLVTEFVRCTTLTPADVSAPARAGGAGAADLPRRRRAAAGHVLGARPAGLLRRARGAARRAPARRLRVRARAGGSDRRGAPAQRAGAVPQRPAPGEPARGGRRRDAGRLGVRRHGPSDVRSRQPRGQQRVRRGGRGAAPDRLLRRSRRAPPGARRSV